MLVSKFHTPCLRRGAIRLCLSIRLIVENKVIIEVKSVESLKPIHSVQLLTYLKLTDCKLGLLLTLTSSTSKKSLTCGKQTLTPRTSAFTSASLCVKNKLVFLR
jgi:hypothetical protein